MSSKEDNAMVGAFYLAVIVAVSIIGCLTSSLSLLHKGYVLIPLLLSSIILIETMSVVIYFITDKGIRPLSYHVGSLEPGESLAASMLFIVFTVGSIYSDPVLAYASVILFLLISRSDRGGVYFRDLREQLWWLK